MKTEFSIEECTEFATQIFSLILWESSQRMVEMFQTVNECLEDSGVKRAKEAMLKTKEKRGADARMYPKYKSERKL